MDPFQTDEDRRSEKWAGLKAKIQIHKQQVRQYEAAIKKENEAIKQLYEALEEE